MKRAGARVEVELSSQEVLAIARLIRNAERRALRHVDPEFVPEPGKRDRNVHQAETYARLKARLLAAIDATADDIEPEGSDVP